MRATAGSPSIGLDSTYVKKRVRFAGHDLAQARFPFSPT
jgi:hypothetical protein